MTLTVYGIKHCDSVKKALRWLDAEGISYQFVDFKTDTPSAEQVRAWLQGVGDSLVNTKGTSYRQLPESLRSDFTGESRVRAIVEQPTLIKRPLLVNGGAMAVGFSPDSWKAHPDLLTD